MNAETVYTLKAVVESETDKDKQNDKVTDVIPKTEASGSEEECHSADDVLTVGHAMIGDCSRESKTDSELECFGVLKYKIGTAADQEEQSNKNVKTKEKKESDESIESKERKQGDESKTGNESQKEGVVKVKEHEFETCDESPKVVEEESKAKEIEQSEKNESQKEGVVEDSKKKEEGTENSEYSETDDSVECQKMKGGEQSDESEGTEVFIKKPSEKNVEKSKCKGAGGGGHLPCFYCGETFSSIYSMRAHLDYVHLWPPSDSTSQGTSNNEETDKEVCDVKTTKECRNISKESSTEETQKEEKSEKSNKEISVVDATNPSDISIVKESEGSDEERKQNKAKDTSLDTSEVKVRKMQESDNEVEIVNVIETNIQKGEEEVKELSPDRSIVKMRNPKLITLKDMPTRWHDKTRGQFMCRLALQMKNRDNCYIKKDDVVCSDTSFSDLTSGDNGNVSDEVHDESSVM